MRSCSIPGCGRPHRARGWCNAHWRRWQRHGDPLAGRTPEGEAYRFYKEVALSHSGDECLSWPYATNAGRAVIRINSKFHYVARLVCEDVNGPPPTPDHQAAHSCGKGDEGCISPAHLDWKTQSENEADKLKHGTHNRGERHYSARLKENAQ